MAAKFIVKSPLGKKIKVGNKIVVWYRPEASKIVSEESEDLHTEDDELIITEV